MYWRGCSTSLSANAAFRKHARRPTPSHALNEQLYFRTTAKPRMLTPKTPSSNPIQPRLCITVYIRGNQNVFSQFKDS